MRMQVQVMEVLIFKICILLSTHGINLCSLSMVDSNACANSRGKSDI